MTVRNDKELLTIIYDHGDACIVFGTSFAQCVVTPGESDIVLSTYLQLLAYIDEHYIPKRDTTTMEDIRARAAEINVPDNFVEKKRVAAVTEMTIDRALQDALTAIRYYEDCHSEEWPCLQDVESRVLSVIDKLEGLSIV